MRRAFTPRYQGTRALRIQDFGTSAYGYRALAGSPDDVLNPQNARREWTSSCYPGSPYRQDKRPENRVPIQADQKALS